MPATQSLAPPPPSNPPPRRLSPAPADLGDPVQLLQGRGITEANKGSLRALVDALKGFTDFRRDGVSAKTYNIGKEWDKQLMAITTLLDEVASTPVSAPTGASPPATRDDLRQAVADIKSSLGPQPPLSYTAAAHGHGPALPTRLTPHRPIASPETQEKEIFISMKNANRDAPFFRFPVTELTAHCSALPSAFFKDPKNGGIDMPSALHGSSCLPNGNIVLTFKSKDDVTRACVHADEWVKLINEGSTTPHHTFAVVAHNAPAAIWTDQTQVAAASCEIERANGNVGALDLDIANLSWLNSEEACAKSGHGPLMISFKTKAAATAAIDQNLTLCGVSCSVSIYVPWPPQCF